MRILIAIAAAALVASPVVAADTTGTATSSATVAPKTGATLRDAKGVRLGPIDSVNADGSVQIIFDSKIVTIPASKIVAGSNGVATSLTRLEVYKMLP